MFNILFPKKKTLPGKVTKKELGPDKRSAKNKKPILTKREITINYEYTTALVLDGILERLDQLLARQNRYDEEMKELIQAVKPIALKDHIGDSDKKIKHTVKRKGTTR